MCIMHGCPRCKAGSQGAWWAHQNMALPKLFESVNPKLDKPKMMLTNNKDLKKILKDAQTRGWEFLKSPRGHIKGKHPSGKTATISVSPSDHRVLMNIEKDLRT